MMMMISRLLLRSLILAALAVASGSAVRAQDSKQEPKLPPGARPPKPAPIDRDGVLILIRSTLFALDHANKTGNYTVLRDLGSPGFRTNTAARLAEIFAPQRKDNIDLSGIAVLDPQLTMLPQIEANGMMHMAGFFPSGPTQVNFELAYMPVDRQWRLFGMSVSFGQAAPVAPPPPEEEHPAPESQAAPLKGKPRAQAAPPAATPTAQAAPLKGKPRAQATPPAAAPTAQAAPPKGKPQQAQSASKAQAAPPPTAPKVSSQEQQ
jgi:hypothetical protein